MKYFPLIITSECDNLIAVPSTITNMHVSEEQVCSFELVGKHENGVFDYQIKSFLKFGYICSEFTSAA